jgi:hypothetical protein
VSFKSDRGLNRYIANGRYIVWGYRYDICKRMIIRRLEHVVWWVCYSVYVKYLISLAECCIFASQFGKIPMLKLIY